MEEFEDPELEEKESKLRSLLDNTEAKRIVEEVQNFEVKHNNIKEFMVGLDSSYLSQITTIDESTYDMIQEFKSFPIFRSLFPQYQDSDERKLGNDAYQRKKTIEMWGLDSVDFIEKMYRVMEHTRKILTAYGILLEIERNGNKKLSTFLMNKSSPKEFGKNAGGFADKTPQEVGKYYMSEFEKNGKVPSNEEIISHMNKQFPWWSNQLNNGNITGMKRDGLTILINEGVYSMEQFLKTNPTFKLADRRVKKDDATFIPANVNDGKLDEGNGHEMEQNVGNGKEDEVKKENETVKRPSYT